MVRRVLEEGRQPKSVPNDYGVGEWTVHKWVAC